MNILAKPFLGLVWRNRQLRRGAVLCAVLALVAAGAELAVALSLIPVLSTVGVEAGGDLENFVAEFPALGWLLIFGIAAALRSGANWFSTIYEQKSTQNLVVALQSRLYRALAKAHWDTVRRITPPAITSALQTQTYEAGYGFSYLIQIIAALFLIAAYLASSAVVFPIALPIFLLVLALMWQLNVRRSKHVHTLAEDYVEAQTDLHRRYEDWVAINRIASLGLDAERIAARFVTNARDAADYSIGYSRSSAATRISYDAAVVIGILVGVPVAWWLETPPAVLTFGLLALIRILPRAGSIQSGYQGIVNAVAPLSAVEQLAQTLESDPVQSVSTAEVLKWSRLSLRAIAVADALRDDGDHSILQNIDLSISHGEWLALSGPTGAGKTTLADVLLTLVRPSDGEVLIDDVPVDDVLAARWRNQSAYVPQDVVLFDASIRDNLRVFRPQASDEELATALEKSAAEFVITRLPDGLDTRAGPGGRWLSGGERQRIGIARALLRQPGFLVLDEPTAALDAETQQKLMLALSKLEHDLCLILITHRAEMLELVDRVIRLEDGKIVSDP